MTQDIDQLLADIDELIDQYHYLVDTGAIPDLDLTDIPLDPAEEETDVCHRGVGGQSGTGSDICWVVQSILHRN